jgi:hypothetical protein
MEKRGREKKLLNMRNTMIQIMTSNYSKSGALMEWRTGTQRRPHNLAFR